MGRNKVTRTSKEDTYKCKSRPKSRKKPLNPAEMEHEDEGVVAASAKKFKTQNEYQVPKNGSIDYRIINFYTVFSVISTLVKCATCDEKVNFASTSERGLGFKIAVTCKNCPHQYIPSSPYVGHGFEINRRFMFAMRTLGVGFKGATKFCGLMDFPSFFARSTYVKILEQMYTASKSVAEFFMKKAVKEEVENNSEATKIQNNKDLTVSGDGIAAYIATCEFNEGTHGLLAVMDGFGISCGPNAHAYATSIDKEREAISVKRAGENTREARMLRRQRQIAAHEASIEEEGPTYGPGIDDSM